MTYIIPNHFDPNTAATNRFLALLEGLDVRLSQEDKWTVLFFFPNESNQKIDKEYKHISIKYLWDSKLFIPQKYLKYVSYLFFIWLFYIKLKKGDRVLFLGHPDIMSFIIKKKGIKVYHEMNEHPAVVPIGNSLIKLSTEKYLRVCRKLDGLFVISTSLKEYFVKEGIDPNRVYIYNMIVDPSRFDNLTKDLTAEKYIAYCGTALNSKDGVDQLLSAFVKISNQIPDVHLYIVGRIPRAKDREKDLALLEKNNATDKVKFLGVVPAKQMPALLVNAQVLVLARPNNLQAKNGFPTKLGEYLLSGNPVVVSAVGDIPLFLSDGESALLTEPDNIDSVADKMLWAIKNPEEAMEIGRKGHDVAISSFNPVVEAEKIINTLN